MKECINCREMCIQSDIIGDYCVYCYDGDEIERNRDKLKVVVFKDTYYYNYANSRIVNISKGPVNILNYRSVHTINCFTVNREIENAADLERHAVSFVSYNNLHDELYHDLSLYTGHEVALKVVLNLEENMKLKHKYIMAKYREIKVELSSVKVFDTAGNNFVFSLDENKLVEVEES